MGFLDNSNANIIVDAVLTDLGRKLLAANDNSFAIRRFSLGDDEVDYGIITKFGVTVGKEKIEKNTPIFEAQTNSDLALKYNCLSLNAVALTAYPTLNLSARTGAAILTTTAGSVTGYSVNLTAGSTSGLKSSTIQITQTMPTVSSAIVSNLIEDLYYVKVNRRFLSVNTTVAESQPNGVDVYEILPSVSTTTTTTGAGIAELVLETILANTSSDFSTYGDGSQILTPVKIIGARTGITVDLTVKITK
jgi:hypothetical protein